MYFLMVHRRIVAEGLLVFTKNKLLLMYKISLCLCNRKKLLLATVQTIVHKIHYIYNIEVKVSSIFMKQIKKLYVHYIILHIPSDTKIIRVIFNTKESKWLTVPNMILTNKSKSSFNLVFTFLYNSIKILQMC